MFEKFIILFINNFSKQFSLFNKLIQKSLKKQSLRQIKCLIYQLIELNKIQKYCLIQIIRRGQISIIKKIFKLISFLKQKQNLSINTSRIEIEMSHLYNTSQQLHSLSEENSRLNQNLISITLNHQSLLQENKHLAESLKRKDLDLVESILREKNFQHNLQKVKQQYGKLQNQYKSLYDWMQAENKLQLREFYKKQCQLAMDMAFIESQSYREAKKSKNQQLSIYQKSIVELTKQNSLLKREILQITSEYNAKIYQLKSINIENQVKLKNLKNIEQKKKKANEMAEINNSQIGYLQLQISFKNLTEKMQFYRKQNSQIKRRNNELLKQLQRSLQNSKQNRVQHQKIRQHLQEQIKAISQPIKQTSLQFITQLIRQNTNLHKQMQTINTKYNLFTQTYPQLIQQQQQILELQSNMQKLQNFKHLENQLKEQKIKCENIQKILIDLENKYLYQLKDKENIQYKTSIIIKRFNQMFIKMNPFFDIYQYQGLELDQDSFQFFDKHKNYKQLKEYQSKLLFLKRQYQELQLKNSKEQQRLKLKIQQQSRQIAILNDKLTKSQASTQNLTDANLILKETIKLNKKPQSNSENPNASDMQGEIINNSNIYQSNIQTEVTVPLLQELIQKLHLEREHLLKIIYEKDNRITELSQQIHFLILAQPIQTICISNQPKNNTQNILSLKHDFSELIKQNQQLQQKYDSTVQQFKQQIKRMQIEINQQHNAYQLEVKQYQRNYQQNLTHLKATIDEWMRNCEDLKKNLQALEEQISLEKNKNQMQQEQHLQENQLAQDGQRRSLNEENANHEENHPHENILFRHPSQTLLERVPNIQQEDGNRLTGQSTVQNLTSTLKKYQHDMSQVLTMCAKLSEEYSEVKKKLKNQEQLQNFNTELKRNSQSFEIENKQINSYLQQKNKALDTIQALFKVKSQQCQQLKQSLINQSQTVQANLENQRKRNEILNKQLSQVKQKMYQIASHPQSEQKSLNKGQFETIVVMQSNKNKELNQLSERNKNLEQKVESLMKQLNILKQSSLNKKSQQISPIEKAELKQLKQMLQGTSLIQLLRKANEVIEKQQADQIQQQLEQEKQSDEIA